MSYNGNNKPQYNKPIPVTALKERKLALTNFDKENGVSWNLAFEYLYGGVHLTATGFPVKKDNGQKIVNIKARFHLLSAMGLLGIITKVREAAIKGEPLEPYRCETFRDNPENKREKVMDSIVNIGYDTHGIYIGLVDHKDPSKKRRFYINSGQYAVWSIGTTPLRQFEDSINASLGWIETFRQLLPVVVGTTLETPPHVEARAQNKASGNNSSYQQSSAPSPSSGSNYDDDTYY